MAENNIEKEQFKDMLSQQGEHVINMSKFRIDDFDFPVNTVKNIVFSDTEWVNINAQKKVFTNIIFNDCEIYNVNFTGSLFTNVKFKNCTLKNVIMNNIKADVIVFENTKIIGKDSNSEESFLNLDIEKLVFIGSELKKINVYGSEVNLVFKSSIIEDVSGYGLKPNSSIFIEKSKIILMEFSSSELDFLEVKESSIIDSKINDSSIGKVVLINNIFNRFSISSGGKYGEVKVTGTSGIVVRGSGPVHDVTITGCADKKNVYIAKMIFDNSKIENCNINKLTSFEAKGKFMIIKDVSANVLDLEEAEIETLILDNVHIIRKIYMNNAKVKNYQAKNITFGENIIIKDKGASFKINSTD